MLRFLAQKIAQLSAKIYKIRGRPSITLPL
jgi:hypothetical protein